MGSATNFAMAVLVHSIETITIVIAPLIAGVNEPLAMLLWLDVCEPLLPPANEVCEGYVFTGVCLSTPGGVCMVAGGRAWFFGGACMVFLGGRMWLFRGVCGFSGGHAWFF